MASTLTRQENREDVEITQVSIRKVQIVGDPSGPVVVYFCCFFRALVNLHDIVISS